MNKINKILACIDFSPYSLMTLEYAVELAKGTGKQIIVFNVINQQDLDSIERVRSYLSGKINVDDYVKEIRKDRQKKIKTIIKENFFDEKSIMSLKIDTGIPFECILKAIKEEEVDLVVMANKGRGNISKILFGSAAEKVFRHSPVPVMSLRTRSEYNTT